MRAIMHVDSIGSPESCRFVRDALLLHRNRRLFVATSYRKLCSISSREKFEIAIPSGRIFEREVRIGAEYIRRHWPGAKILLIDKSERIVDDPLYDERVLPGISPEGLLEPIEHLAVGITEREWQTPSRPRLRTREIR